MSQHSVGEFSRWVFGTPKTWNGCEKVKRGSLRHPIMLFCLIDCFHAEALEGEFCDDFSLRISIWSEWSIMRRLTCEITESQHLSTLDKTLVRLSAFTFPTTPCCFDLTFSDPVFKLAGKGSMLPRKPQYLGTYNCSQVSKIMRE